MSLQQRLRLIEPFLPDFGLGMSAIWASKCFTNEPSPAATYPAAYIWLHHLAGSEENLAALSLMSGFLLLFGLVCTASQTLWALSLVVRSIGCLLALFLFGSMSASFYIASSNTITVLPMLLMGLAAMWTLMRAPALPRVLP